VGAARLMRVILDSNILFSALISPIGPPHRIYQAWRAKRFELATCSIQIGEIRRASRYSRLRDVLMPHEVGRMINHLHDAFNVDPLPLTHTAADPDDDWLLSLADSARADFLVTGDRQSGLLPLRRIGTTRILTAAVFCRDALRERR
jgi:uncharacterized protein